MDGSKRIREVKGHRIAGTHSKRTISQQLYFAMPEDVFEAWSRKVENKGKVIHRCELLNLSDYDIITRYEVELQGVINYYSRVHNQKALRHLRYKWKESLLKTLANKHKRGMNHIRRKYGKFYNTNKELIIGVEIQREKKKPLRATFGKKPIQRQCRMEMKDEVQTVHIKRNELLGRLLADRCELCGREDNNLNGHHVRKLKDLKDRWNGKREKPTWVRRMIEIRRKTLFVCKECHQKIHAGTYDGSGLT